MKNQKRIIIALLCTIAIFVVSCKEEIIENTSELTTQLAGDYYRGIDVKTDSRYGTFLSFGSLEQVKKLSVGYLDELSQDELLEWSKNIGHSFESQLIIGQNDYKFGSEKAFADPSVAAILNKGGYVMIDNQIHRFYDQIGSYEVLDSNGAVQQKVELDDIVSLSNAKVNACKSATTKSVSASAYNCPWNGNKEYHIEGRISYTKPLIGTQKLIVRTNCYKQACGTAYYNPYSANSLGAEVSYDIIVDGVSRKGQVQRFTAYNNNAFSYTLASGNNICVGFIVAKHFEYPTSSTYLEKDNTGIQ